MANSLVSRVKSTNKIISTYWKEPLRLEYICLYDDKAEDGPVNFNKSAGWGF